MKSYKNVGVLMELYWKESLSLNQIARKFGVSRPTVRYWMRKNKIQVRPPKLKYRISESLLENLYIKRKFSTLQIAKQLNIKSRETIRRKIIEFDFPRRTRMEAITKYAKTSFSSSLMEKAYIIGLRIGDLAVTKNHNQIRISTTTTHPAQIELIEKVFSKYSHIKVYDYLNNGRKQYHVYCDVNQSFDFLLKKSEVIPEWIICNEDLFFSFLAGYSDAEGCWSITKNDIKSISFGFRLSTGDKNILIQIKNKLEELGFSVSFHLSKKVGDGSGFGIRNKDIYVIQIHKRSNIIKLLEKLLPSTQHNKKIRKMSLIKEIEDYKSWNDVKDRVLNLRNEIKTEVASFIQSL